MPHLLLVMALGLLMQMPAAPRPLSFSDGHWDLRDAAIVKEGGRDVLQIGTGDAFRRDVLLEDGTIECDVFVTDRRSFVYVYFRAASDEEREEVYLRPHKSGLPDAIQYAPVWQGRSAWQLYHGPGATAAPLFRQGEWARLRIVLQGRRAAVFLDDMSKPVLLGPSLAHDPRAGFIGVGGFLPANVPGSGPIAKFANVTVQPGHVPFDFEAALTALPAAPPAAVTSGIVRDWLVSSAFPVPADASVLPPASVTGAFTRVEAEASGLVPLHKHIAMPSAGAAAAVAKVTIHADAAGTYVFDLGYSDVATVFVNGRPVFQGDQRYSFDRPRREGLIGFDNARLYLPLAAGDNEIAVLVSDYFGGWGVMGRVNK
jgi:hypothetical protein